MKFCPITYDEIAPSEIYSVRGLKLLSPQLKELAPLKFSAEEQRKEAIARVGKMSIQGVQPKLSAQLKVKAGHFEVVDQYGHYILKPQSSDFAELPENEALTMTLAQKVGIEVPVHGLVYAKEGSFTYFIKRFDRAGHHKKIPVEDFAQLSQMTRTTKYNSSMENVLKVLNFCSYPKIEAVKLFKLTLFNFLIGNEDMHLKNFSLISRGNQVMLSPAYDLLNTSIALVDPAEELALPLNGRKNNLRRKDFVDYFAKEKLQLNDKVIARVADEFVEAFPVWDSLIKRSFLSKKMQEKYLMVLEERKKRLGFV
jgi:serine/threonine-protein kinase HipA